VARQGTLQFLARALQSTKEAPTKSDLEAIAPAIVGQLGDSLEPVRSAAAEGLGALSKIFGERPMNPFLDKITDAQKSKINEAMGKVEVKCKAGAKPVRKVEPVGDPTPATQPKLAEAPKAKMPARLASRFGAVKPASTADTQAETDTVKPSESTETVGSRPPSVASVARPALATPPVADEFEAGPSASTPIKRAGPPARLMARAPPVSWFAIATIWTAAHRSLLDRL
jgi:hypothetical protein